jgi:hypothetical protein
MRTHYRWLEAAIGGRARGGARLPGAVMVDRKRLLADLSDADLDRLIDGMTALMAGDPVDEATTAMFSQRR